MQLKKVASMSSRTGRDLQRYNVEGCRQVVGYVLLFKPSLFGFFFFWRVSVVERRNPKVSWILDFMIQKGNPLLSHFCSSYDYSYFLEIWAWFSSQSVNMLQLHSVQIHKSRPIHLWDSNNWWFGISFGQLTEMSKNDVPQGKHLSANITMFKVVEYEIARFNFLIQFLSWHFCNFGMEWNVGWLGTRWILGRSSS